MSFGDESGNHLRSAHFRRKPLLKHKVGASTKAKAQEHVIGNATSLQILSQLTHTHVAIGAIGASVHHNVKLFLKQLLPKATAQERGDVCIVCANQVEAGLVLTDAMRYSNVGFGGIRVMVHLNQHL